MNKLQSLIELAEHGTRYVAFEMRASYWYSLAPTNKEHVYWNRAHYYSMRAHAELQKMSEENQTAARSMYNIDYARGYRWSDYQEVK